MCELGISLCGCGHYYSGMIWNICYSQRVLCAVTHDRFEFFDQLAGGFVTAVFILCIERLILFLLLKDHLYFYAPWRKKVIII